MAICWAVEPVRAQDSPSLSVADATAIEGDDDDPEPELDFTGYTGVHLGEGDVRSVTVTLSQPSGRTVTVDYLTWPAGTNKAEAGSDYAHVAGTLTFAPGEIRRTVRITTFDDELYETPIETFVLEFKNLQGATFARRRLFVEGRWLMVADFHLSDDEMVPSVVVVGALGLESAGELAFPVYLSGPIEAPVSMDYSTANGTAVSGDDYTAATNATLSFAAGETERTVRIAIVDDDVDENAIETFALTLRQGYAPLADSTGDLEVTGTIQDDDGTTGLAVGDATASEGEGSLTFAVTLGGQSGGSVTVDYATSDGTATAQRDFTDATGTLTFEPGETRRTIVVPLLDDDIHEPSESFPVSLSGAVGANVVHGTATGLIRDDEVPPFITIRGSESLETAIMEFVVTVRPESDATVTVDYVTDRTLIAERAPAFSLADESDFVYQAGTLTFAPTETSKTIRVQILEDAVDEPVEAVVVTLTDPVNARFATRQGSPECPWSACGMACCDCGTIIDDDASPVLAVTGGEDVEGGTARFDVTLAGSTTSRRVTVDYATRDGTATADEDYRATRGALTFVAGTTSKTVSVTLLDDDVDEGKERFTLELSSPVNATLGVGTAAGTIIDDDWACLAASPGRVLLFAPSTHPHRQGFVRIINHSAEAGEVRIEAIDDSGHRIGSVPLSIGRRAVGHFNSDDLETGNPDKGLADGLGPVGDGSLRLELTSSLDIEVLSYMRTRDGFVTSLHDPAPAAAGCIGRCS